MKSPSPRVRALVKKSESCPLKSYADPASPLGIELRKPTAQRVVGWTQLSGDPWTIGYGHTKGVRPGQTITQEQADKFLDADLAEAAAKLNKKVGASVVDALTQNQYDALVDFVFNMGTGDPDKKEWTIWVMLRAKNFDGARMQLARFVNAGKPPKQYKGLVDRRAAEMSMWAEDEPGSSPEVLPSSVTRNIPTPPTPTVTEPAHKSATLWATVTTAVGGAGALVAQHVEAAVQTVTSIFTPDHVNTALAAVSPYAEKSNYVAQAAQGLAALGAILVVWLAFRKRKEAQQ